MRKTLITLAATTCLTLGAGASVIQTFSDMENILNFSSGTNLGTFSVAGTPDLFLAYTLTWNSGTVGSNKFVVMYLGDQNGGVNFGLKSNQGPGDADFVMRFGSGTPIAYAADQITIPSAVRILGRIQDTNNNGDYDTAAMWINPEAADLNSPDASISGFSITISPSPLGLRSVNLSSDDIDLTDIVVTNDFASAVPEPAAFSLLGLAGAVVLLRRSRQQAA